jgi:hypothetical protein
MEAARADGKLASNFLASIRSRIGKRSSNPLNKKLILTPGDANSGVERSAVEHQGADFLTCLANTTTIKTCNAVNMTITSLKGSRGLIVYLAITETIFM